MDVRCEKCQTEYELDEARLKPGGVTVKCTNCGHMFKIRKRSNTNVGVPTVVATPPSGPTDRPRTPSGKPQPPRADSILGEAPAVPLEGERQWLIRLENGEQKSCRELAMLQQWIVAGVVTRESLISRTGKTWKRLGDISELAQYFTIADEARSQRGAKPTGKKDIQPTMLGIGATAAGGTILPDDDDHDGRTTGNFSARGKPTPPPAPRRPITQPPPPPPRKDRESQSGPLPAPNKPAPSVPISNRSTAMWATEGVSPTAETQKDQGPSGGFGGRIKPSSEPAFAGRVRVEPGDESAFNTGKVQQLDDDDDDLLPQRRGSRSGTLLLVMALLVMGVAAGVVYVFVIKKSKPDDTAGKAPADAAVVAVTSDATAASPTPDAADAAAALAMSPVDLARAELGADLELKLRDALKSLDGNTSAGAEAMRAHLAAQIAQGLLDRAAVTADKSEAEKLKKDAKTLVIDAATTAQRAFKTTPDDPGANLAMAEVLRLQDKSSKDVKRYLETAKAKQTDDWKRGIALAEALTLVRDKKLDDARTALTAIDTGDDKLEVSGDVRARFHLALVAYLQNKPADAKPLLEQILAAQPEHAGAKALAARIENTVNKGDPLPPEEGAGSAKPEVPTGPGPSVGAADTYDSLLAKANKVAESNCAKASELFAKALEQKPNGVEALTGMGYCHIDAKQFASAFSKFRAALAISSRYEPALWGVAEAYTQQGRKEQALEAVKAYLDAYPGAPKATKALDRLGGSTAPPPDKPPEGSGATTPTPTPTPTPTEPGAGSGSG